MGEVSRNGSRCSGCGTPLIGAPSPYPPCPTCGSTTRTIDMGIASHLRLTSELKYKQKRPGFKQPIAWGKTGDAWSYRLVRFVKRSLHFDRERDHYHETVTDRTTGEV